MNGKNYLFVIGIDAYNHANFPNLDNARRDAIRIKQILEDVYGFEHVGMPLVDSIATRANIIDALAELANYCLEEDNLIIFFAGHGRELGSGGGYWVPVDGGISKSNFIMDREVAAYLEGLKAKHILVISDSCFSGRMFQKTRSALTTAEYEELEARNSRWVFSSGRDTVKDGVKGEGSLFCQSVCKFLEDNKDRIFSAGELFQQVIEDLNGVVRQVPEPRFIDVMEHDDGLMVFRSYALISDTTERGTYTKVVFPLLEIKSLQFYIPRTVSLFDPGDAEIISFFRTEKERIALRDLILSQKRIVLLGSAGSGKSVELNQLAKVLQAGDIPLVPIFKRFNTYTDQDIEDYLLKGWELINPSSLVLFLDGLDEVQSSYFHVALRKLTAFAEKHPTISIVVSCRSNFYELPKKNFSGALIGFTVYNLNDISILEIADYATKHFQLNGEEFVGAAEHAGLKELIQKPYFLDIIIRYFKTHGELKGKRSEIMEDALENYYWENREHFKTTGPVAPKALAFAMLEKIAFVMEMMGTNYISDPDLRSLFTTQLEFDNCRYLPAFRRDDEKEQWMFEHNNIQEFLAARVLQRQPFDKLTEIVSQNLSGELKIKPTWVNTLSFLVAIGDESTVKPLLEWILKNEVEILVRFDAGRLSDMQRIEVFKQIFSDYNDKGIWVLSNNFSDRELAAFGYYESVIIYLLEKIEDPKQPRIAKLNALHILDNYVLNDFQGIKDRVRNALISLLNEFDKDPADTYGIQSVLRAMATLRINDKELTAEIVQRFSKRLNQHVRSGLYNYLHNSPYLDEYIHVFLEGLDISEIDGAIKDREEVNLMDESFHLTTGLEKIKKPDGLLKLLPSLWNRNRQRGLFFSDYKGILEHLVINLVEASKTEAKIYPAVLDFYKQFISQYEHKLAELVIPFFEQTGTKELALETLWKENIDKEPYHNSEICGLLLDEKSIKHLIEIISVSAERDKELDKLNNILDWHRYQIPNLDLMKEIVKEIAVEWGVSFTPRPVYVDWNERQRAKLQPAFDLLFRPNDLIAAVKDIFDGEEKELITSDDLYGLRSEIYKDPEDTYTLSALELLRDMTFRGFSVSFQFVQNWSENGDNLLQYRIDKVHDYLKGSNSALVHVSEEQKVEIKRWCKEKQLPDDIAWFFLTNFSASFSAERLLDLTGYYNYAAQPNATDPGVIDELENYLPSDVIQERVIRNLNTGLPEIMSWISNASYAIRKKLRQAYPVILGYLQSVTDAEYKLDDVLSLWFNSTDDTAGIKVFIEKAISERFRWEAISLLLKTGRERDFLTDYLKKQLNDPATDIDYRFRAANFLVQLGDMEGFDFAANYITSNPDPKLDFDRNLISFKLISDAQVVNKLMELLLIAKRTDFQANKFNSLESKIMEAVINIGVQSTSNFVIVKAALEKFIEDNTGKIEHVNFLHVRIKGIEEQLRMKESRTVTVADALAEYNKL